MNTRANWLYLGVVGGFFVGFLVAAAIGIALLSAATLIVADAGIDPRAFDIGLRALVVPFVVTWGFVCWRCLRKGSEKQSASDEHRLPALVIRSTVGALVVVGLVTAFLVSIPIGEHQRASERQADEAYLQSRWVIDTVLCARSGRDTVYAITVPLRGSRASTYTLIAQVRCNEGVLWKETRQLKLTEGRDALEFRVTHADLERAYCELISGGYPTGGAALWKIEVDLKDDMLDSESRSRIPPAETTPKRIPLYTDFACNVPH